MFMASSICRTLVSNIVLHPITRLNPSSFGRIKCQPVRSMSSELSQRIFQLRFNPLTGNSEWVVIEESEEENSPKALLSSTSYLDMLNDSPRNRAFCKAIEKTVIKPCHVLDIGSGTGLLSMMAARAMDSSDAKHYTGSKGILSACESYLPMVKLMRKVLRINNMEKKIRIFHKRSDELKVGHDLASRANILLVESTFLWKLHDLYNNEAKALDNVHLVPAELERILRVKPQQYAMHCDAIAEEIRLLSDPFKVFEFDFSKRPESHGQTELHIKATSDGRVHAIVSWWVLQLDYEGTIFYSTAPRWINLPFNCEDLQTQSHNWCDHWKQCVWFIPGIGILVSKDEQVDFQAVHNDISISYNLKHGDSKLEQGYPDFHTRGCQLILSPERIAIYGDREWRYDMLRAVMNALQKKVSPLCVVADDSVFLTILLANLSPSSNIISVFPGLQEKGAQYLQAVADANGFSINRVNVLGKRPTCLTTDDTDQKKVDLLIGEPFYYGNEGKLPWENLRFWKERTMLDKVLSKDVLIMPCKGILKGCAMSLPDLWRSRRALEIIEGFDHSVVNTTLGACGDLPVSQGPSLPYFIWQCGEIKELSEAFTIMEFDFSKPISLSFGKTKVGFTEAGICHGFVLWIDWILDVDHSIVLSTGPKHRYWKQGVKLLSKPVAVGNHGSSGIGDCSFTEIEASFNPSDGELIIRHDFL
ncbi:PREDICTED: protein arginine N-methyltransferase 7 isoform X2 [Nelumbo nucifera]|uniref:Protein arginine N-methyltransferase 7 isoform X2 n=1 Tax=Nelumbo nucifera TaxID=4432 RepID=A0A1U8AA03_NELNU|nr:PREDICTED: protein arginine N-methyltransferase 7 isoform X2 [Nelumbo nucifera]